jgi:hypothetical protein
VLTPPGDECTAADRGQLAEELVAALKSYVDYRVDSH